MDSTTGPRIPVEPTRIMEIGIGSFLILAGGVLWALSCVFGNALIKDGTVRCKMHLLITAAYGAIILYLANAERRSRWEIPGEELASDVDNTWLVHIFLGSTIAVACGLGLFAAVEYEYCSVVVANEIETQQDRRRSIGRAKFLF
ncbi:hypothetical protein ACHAXT_005859 [Thalassiosira profunda]